MRTADQWLSEYESTHQNPVNKKIHWICVPAIFWSVVALLWSLPVPGTLQVVRGLNWATIVAFFALLFYLKLGIAHFLRMLVVTLAALAFSAGLAGAGLPLAWISGGVFVVAWIGQFYGHKVEGKKPSFFDDLLFLLIGPLWIIEALRKRA